MAEVPETTETEEEIEAADQEDEQAIEESESVEEGTTELMEGMGGGLVVMGPPQAEE